MNKDKTIANQAKRKKEVHAFGMLKANEKTIKNQAKVIKDIWGKYTRLCKALEVKYPDIYTKIIKEEYGTSEEKGTGEP